MLTLKRWVFFAATVFLGARLATAQTTKTSFQFFFGSGKAPKGFIQVTAESTFDKAKGYGFEAGAEIQTVGNAITSNKPFYFSVAVPEGNYRVTAALGEDKAASVTTIKAELRRLMVEKVDAAPGKVERRTFVVNVRVPQIRGGGEVRLKPREKTSEARAWDELLTLEFTNTHPALRALEIERVNDIPTVYIAGDSTSTDQPGEPFNSWGQMITRFFKPDIAVANHGESGESLRSFFGEKRFDKIMSLIRTGDYLLVQMGHNDQKDRTPGAGAFTSYKEFLERMVAGARDKGATPILITSMNRLAFDADNKVTNTLGDFPEAVRQVAKEENVALIDLNAMSRSFYEALGPVDGHQAFAGKDTTHHDNYGSYELAKCIIQGIVSLDAGSTKPGLATHIVSDFPGFDPAHPDAFSKFDIPADPALPAARPYGN